MKNQEIVEKLEAISADLYHVRLPVEEANAYGTILTSANRIAKMVREMKEEAINEADDKPE